MKKCYKCNINREFSYFSKDKSRPDGLQSMCRSCRSEYHKSDSYKKSKFKYRRSDKGKESQLREHENHRNAYISTRRFNNKIQSGAIEKRFRCSKCSTFSTHIEAHHCDYDYPFDVMWLCKKCHVDWHKNNKPKNSKYGIFNKKQKQGKDDE